MSENFNEVLADIDDNEDDDSTSSMSLNVDDQGSDSSDDIDQSNALHRFLTLALLQSGSISFVSSRRNHIENLVNFPCPDMIANSDLSQIIKINQGMILPDQQRGKLCNSAINLRQREINRNSFSHSLCTKLATSFIPNYAEKEILFNEKNFCGTYSEDGRYFLSACQDNHIRIYSADTFGNSDPFKDISARGVGWSVLDASFSSDSRMLAYSSWSPYIHLCSVFDHDFDSAVHEELPLHPSNNNFAVFSLQFTKDSSEILCGSSCGYIYIYSLALSKRILKIDAHEDDVNAICFADDCSQILYSGSDDGLIKVWDRRLLSDTASEPVGIFAGHQDGITFIDTLGDARYLLSNSKDQSIKLWDIRRFSSGDAIENAKKVIVGQTWDYRWQSAPWDIKKRKSLSIQGDSSIFTYTGHRVLNTLIRARFSPRFSTGNKYIYCGCSTGKCFIYDLLTGKIVATLNGHRKCVRDVSWHPYEQKIITSSWEGCVKLWNQKRDNDCNS